MTFPFPMMRPRRTVSVSFTDHTSSGSSTTAYTFTGRAIGTADVGRIVVVAVHTNGGTAGSSGVTIGGISATKAVSGAGSGATSFCELWAALVPSGATAAIVVNFASAPGRCGIGVWALLGISSITPKATGTSQASPETATISVPTSGVVIGAALAVSATFTWTNATEQYDEVLGGSVVEQSGAHALLTSANASYAVTATQTAASATLDCFAVAAWGP